MKHKILVVIAATIFLAACSANTSDTITDSIDFASAPYTPSESSNSQSSEGTLVQNIQYGIHVSSDVSDLKYDGESVTLDVDYVTEDGFTGEMEFGFVLVSDGVPIKSTVDGKESTMHTFTMSAGKEKTLSASFVPFGKSGKTIAVFPVAILNPSFRLSDTQDSFYFYHSVLSTAPLEMRIEKDSVCECKFSDNYEKALSDKAANQKFGIDENDTGIQYLLWQENKKSDPKLYFDTDSIAKFTFVSSGTDVNADMRVSFFVNSQPVTFNGGCDVLNIGLFENYISYSEITLDNPVNQYDSIYAMISPCGSDYQKPISLTKTSSSSFVLDDSGTNEDIGSSVSENSNANEDIGSSVSQSSSTNEGSGSSGCISSDFSSPGENNVSSIEYPSEGTENILVSLAGFGQNGSLFGLNYDKALVVVDEKSSSILKSIPAESNSLSATLQLSSNGFVRSCLVMSDESFGRKAEFFDENLNLICSFNNTDCLAVSADRSRVFRIQSSGKTKYLISDLNGANETEFVLPDKNIYISSAVFADNERLLFTGGDATDDSMGNGVIGLYDTVNGTMKYERFPNVSSEILLFDEGVVFTENSEDGSKIIVADKNFALKTVTTSTPRETNRTAVSYNGEYIATAITKDTATTFRLYSAKSGEMLSERTFDGMEYGNIAVDNSGAIYACFGRSSSKASVCVFSIN